MLSWVRATTGTHKIYSWEQAWLGSKGDTLPGMWVSLDSTEARVGAAVWSGHGYSVFQHKCGLGLRCIRLGQTPAPTVLVRTRVSVGQDGLDVCPC